MTIAGRVTDRAAGALQGAADAARGTKHQARAWSAEHHPDGREAAARERWHAGQPARNTFEHAAYRTFGHQAKTGMDHLNWLGREASRMEAARAAEAEAGQ